MILNNITIFFSELINLMHSETFYKYLKDYFFLNNFINLNIEMKAKEFTYTYIFHNYPVLSRFWQLAFFNLNQKYSKRKIADAHCE